MRAKVAYGAADMGDKDDKQAKREARQLWEQAREAFEAGDYLRASELDGRVIELAPRSEQGRQARQELDGLKMDRWVFRAGLGALVLYAIAWVVGLTS